MLLRQRELQKPRRSTFLSDTVSLTPVTVFFLGHFVLSVCICLCTGSWTSNQVPKMGVWHGNWPGNHDSECRVVYLLSEKWGRE